MRKELVIISFLVLIIANPSCAQILAPRHSALRQRNYWASLRDLREGPFDRPATKQAGSQEPSTSEPKKLPHLGKAFWIPWGFSFAATVASTELTVHCVHIAGCSEENPIWGSRPTRVKLYFAKGGIDVLGFYFSRKWKLSKEGDTFGWNYITYGVLVLQGTDAIWDASMAATAHPKEPAGQPDTSYP